MSFSANDHSKQHVFATGLGNLGYMLIYRKTKCVYYPQLRLHLRKTDIINKDDSANIMHLMLNCYLCI